MKYIVIFVCSFLTSFLIIFLRGFFNNELSVLIGVVSGYCIYLLFNKIFLKK